MSTKTRLVGAGAQPTLHRRRMDLRVMRHLLPACLLVLLLVPCAAHAQDRYVCKAGHIWFTSTTPLEDIEAHSREVAGVLTPKTGEMVFQLLIKTFRFPRALMEEHFNENFMESAKYPKAGFKGRIVDPSTVRFEKNGVYPVTVEGDLTIRSTTRTIKQKGKIEVRDGRVLATSTFDVVPQDYGISIPAAVRDKIAASITVHVEMSYDRQRK